LILTESAARQVFISFQLGAKLSGGRCEGEERRERRGEDEEKQKEIKGRAEGRAAFILQSTFYTSPQSRDTKRCKRKSRRCSALRRRPSRMKRQTRKRTTLSG
jgi:hypothetical protein